MGFNAATDLTAKIVIGPRQPTLFAGDSIVRRISRVRRENRDENEKRLRLMYLNLSSFLLESDLFNIFALGIR